MKWKTMDSSNCFHPLLQKFYKMVIDVVLYFVPIMIGKEYGLIWRKTRIGGNKNEIEIEIHNRHCNSELQNKSKSTPLNWMRVTAVKIAMYQKLPFGSLALLSKQIINYLVYVPRQSNFQLKKANLPPQASCFQSSFLTLLQCPTRFSLFNTPRVPAVAVQTQSTRFSSLILSKLCHNKYLCVFSFPCSYALHGFTTGLYIKFSIKLF